MTRNHLSARLRMVLVGVAGLVLGATLVVATTVVSATPRTASPFHNLELFAQALTRLETSYVDPVDQDKAVQGAIRGMMASLDPHSTFLSPDEYRLMLSDLHGRFAGVGIEVAERDGWLTVLAVFDGGPAAKAGIRPGDRFLKIAGRRARDMRIDEAVRTMRGEPGTTVQVSIRREGREDALELTLTRATIEIPATRAQRLSDGIVYVRIAGFSEKTIGELRAELDRESDPRHHKTPVRGLLLDLRDNGGGLLEQAIEVSDEFLSSGVIVTARGRGNRLLSEARAEAEGTRPAWPIVVLVNQFTASAAEIVAGALRDHGRAYLIGTRTWGKGSVQQVYPLADGSAVKLTIARYYTPSGRSIQAVGIDPDRVVEVPPRPRDPKDTSMLREERLPNHLNAGKRQPADVRRPTLPPAAPSAAGAPIDPSALPERLRGDAQAAAAIEELRARITGR